MRKENLHKKTKKAEILIIIEDFSFPVFSYVFFRRQPS